MTQTKEFNLSGKILNLSWEDGFKGRYIKEEDVKEAIKILKEALKNKCPFGGATFVNDNSAILLSPKDVIESIDKTFGDKLK